MTGKTEIVNQLESRAIKLLAAGLSAAKVAESLGVDSSRISQLLDNDEFKSALADEKFSLLNRHNEADEKLNALEDKVRDRLEQTVEMIFDPMKLTRIFQVVNAAKRRGMEVSGDVFGNSTVVNLNIPQRIVNNFVVNSNNQVIQAGGEDLITIQPHRVQEMIHERDQEKLKSGVRALLAAKGKEGS
jgi:predicted XRE-type DNA-binding protein